MKVALSAYNAGVLERINRQENYDAWVNSGFFTLVRNDVTTDTRVETLDILAKAAELLNALPTR